MSNIKKKPQPIKKFGVGMLLFWIAIFVGFFILISYLNTGDKLSIELPYNEFLDKTENGDIATAHFKKRKITGRFNTPYVVDIKSKTSKSLKYPEYSVVIPYDDPELPKNLAENNVEITSEEDKSGFWSIALSILPWLLIPLLYFLFIRQMSGSQQGIFSFSKSRARRFVPDKKNITFDDVAGCKEPKEELMEIIEFLKSPSKFVKLGGRIPHGVILMGPPGTGKTLLARAAAGEANVPFYSISGSDFVEMFVGVGASRVRDLFEESKRNVPCIVFIDEIDAVGRLRGAGLGGGHDEREHTLNQLLVEMDGFDPNEGIIVIAATNRPDILDKALLRSGRFDRQIVVDRPDMIGRLEILKVHARGKPIDDNVDFEIISKSTPGLVGSDLANIVNEAALLAARKDKEQIQMEDFEEAMDKIMMGLERPSLRLSVEDKRVTAYHEAGHALVGLLQPGADPVHKVSIIPRGIGLGVTKILPESERQVYTKSYLLTILTYLLGGRAAELSAFKEPSTGASNDLRKVTELARKMVAEWGMSEKIGPISVVEQSQEVFLGKDIFSRAKISEVTAQTVDSEVRNIVEKAQDRALKIISDNFDRLKKLAEALIEKEVMTGDEIKVLLNININMDAPLFPMLPQS